MSHDWFLPFAAFFFFLLNLNSCSTIPFICQLNLAPRIDYMLQKNRPKLRHRNRNILMKKNSLLGTPFQLIQFLNIFPPHPPPSEGKQIYSSCIFFSKKKEKRKRTSSGTSYSLLSYYKSIWRDVIKNLSMLLFISVVCHYFIQGWLGINYRKVIGTAPSKYIIRIRY